MLVVCLLGEDAPLDALSLLLSALDSLCLLGLALLLDNALGFLVLRENWSLGGDFFVLRKPVSFQNRREGS